MCVAAAADRVLQITRSRVATWRIVREQDYYSLYATERARGGGALAQHCLAVMMSLNLVADIMQAGEAVLTAPVSGGRGLTKSSTV